MRGFTDLVARRWPEPDAGIWEIRADPVHHVHSKVMGWLALDRALRIAQTHRISARRRRRGETARAAVAADITARGFDPARDTYTRSYGSSDLDSALLILPVTGFEAADSARLRGTVDAVAAELSAGYPFLYRYPPGQDGLSGDEGAFLPCSFWLVQALALTGRTSEAAYLFEALLGVGGPLGLFSEEADPVTGTLLGNYPQALAHAALVQAALVLRDAARKEPLGAGITRERPQA